MLTAVKRTGGTTRSKSWISAGSIAGVRSASISSTSAASDWTPRPSPRPPAFGAG